MRAGRFGPALAPLLLLAACGGGDGTDRSGAAKAVTPLDRSVTGTIGGVVTFQGPPPAMATLQLDPLCARLHAGPVSSGDALVRDGKVENAFVYVKQGLEGRTFAVPSEPVRIDQRGCIYEPRVAGAQTGQPIVYLNSDALLHNVHGTPAQARGWNFAMATAGTERIIRVDRPEVMIHVRCDIHPWMHSYLGVLDHPYFAVTGPDGRFALRDLPPGDYVVASWHERFGTREVRVSLGMKEAKEISFAYAPAGPP
jgi:hypothetical protein